MILKHKAICSPFTLLITDDAQQHIGLRTIRFTNTITKEPEIIQFDLYAELLAHAISPLKRYLFISLMSEKGFLISTLPGALEAFMHLTLFPQDAVTSFGPIEVEKFPEGAEVEFISTRESEEENHER